MREVHSTEQEEKDENKNWLKTIPKQPKHGGRFSLYGQRDRELKRREKETE